jgi:hypothetical protein
MEVRSRLGWIRGRMALVDGRKGIRRWRGPWRGEIAASLEECVRLLRKPHASSLLAMTVRCSPLFNPAIASAATKQVSPAAHAVPRHRFANSMHPPVIARSLRRSNLAVRQSCSDAGQGGTWPSRGMRRSDAQPTCLVGELYVDRCLVSFPYGGCRRGRGRRGSRLLRSRSGGGRSRRARVGGRVRGCAQPWRRSRRRCRRSGPGASSRG